MLYVNGWYDYQLVTTISQTFCHLSPHFIITSLSSMTFYKKPSDIKYYEKRKWISMRPDMSTTCMWYIIYSQVPNSLNNVFSPFKMVWWNYCLRWALENLLQFSLALNFKGRKWGRTKMFSSCSIIVNWRWWRLSVNGWQKCIFLENSSFFYILPYFVIWT